MPMLITAEHFTLNPSLKEKVEAKLSKIENLLPQGAKLRLFLKRDLRKGAHGYQAVLSVHAKQKDIACSERGPHLLTLVSAIQSHFVRSLLAQKRRFLANRRRQRKQSKANKQNNITSH